MEADLAPLGGNNRSAGKNTHRQENGDEGVKTVEVMADPYKAVGQKADDQGIKNRRNNESGFHIITSFVMQSATISYYNYYNKSRRVRCEKSVNFPGCSLRYRRVGMIGK